MDDDASNIGLMSAALEAIGYKQKVLLLNGEEYRQFSKNGIPVWTTYVSPALSYPTTHSAIRNISRDKLLANSFVEMLGFSVPKTKSIKTDGDFSEAYELLDLVGRVIVKPNMASMSRGLTLDIVRKDQIDSAIGALLLQNDTEAIVQEQVFGDEIRFTLIDGKLKNATLRQTARVIGDGLSTLSELIDKEDASRMSIQDTLVSYPSLKSILGMDMDLSQGNRVPRVGEVVSLSRGTMIRTGASMYNITDKIDNSYRLITEKIASSLPAGFIVIDLIIADYTKPVGQSAYWFIEFNTSPVLRLFYSCRDGQHFDIAKLLAKYIDDMSNCNSSQHPISPSH